MNWDTILTGLWQVVNSVPAIMAMAALQLGSGAATDFYEFGDHSVLPIDWDGCWPLTRSMCVKGCPIEG